MSGIVPDPKLTFSEANYLAAVATIIQRERPDYANDAVLTNARLKMLDVKEKYARANPEAHAEEHARIDMENRLRGGGQ